MVRIKIVVFLSGLMLVMAGTITGLILMLQSKSDQLDRAENNISILTDTLNYFRDKTGQQALRIGELQMTNTEIEHSKDSVIQKLVRENKNMGNKLKRTEQLLNIQTEASDSLIIRIKDTTIYRERDTITGIAPYKDKWIDLTLTVTNKQIEMDYIFRDDLIVSIGWHREKKKFFLWNWLGLGKKIYDADIKSTNPSSKIIYSKNVRVTGKRGRR